MSAPDPSILVDKLIKGEYEAQFFNTSAVSLAYSLKEFIKSYVQTSLNKLCSVIEDKASNPDELAKTETLMKVLRERYESAINEYYAEMEPKIHEIFNIPSYLLLPEDAAQKVQYTNDEEEKLDEEIESLKLRYKRATCMEALLKKLRHSIKCIDVIEKVTFEIEDDVDAYKRMYEDKEKNLEEIVHEILEFQHLEVNLQKLYQ